MKLNIMNVNCSLESALSHEHSIAKTTTDVFMQNSTRLISKSVLPAKAFCHHLLRNDVKCFQFFDLINS